MQINDSLGFHQKIHSQNSIDFKSVIHASHLKIKVAQFLIANLQTINLSPKYNFLSTHTANRQQHIIG